MSPSTIMSQPVKSEHPVDARQTIIQTLVASIDRLDKLTSHMEDMVAVMQRCSIVCDQLIKREEAVTAREEEIGRIVRTRKQAMDAGMTIHIGERGGNYYISKGGNRVYVTRDD